MLKTAGRWGPALLWYRIIWGFSAQSAAVSGSLSDRLLYRVMALLSPAFSAADLQTQNAAVELLSFLERKAAHMFLYFVLVLLLWLAIAPLIRGRHRQIALSAALCAALASLDECHQLLVPGRSGQVRDVFIDLAGAAAALALSGLLRWIVRRRQAGRPVRPAWLGAGGLLLLMGVVVSPMGAAAPAAVQAAALPETVAPVVREFCFLALCGLLGCCTALCAALSGLSRPAAAACAAVSSALPAGGAACLLAPAILPCAFALGRGGGGRCTGLWLVCLHLLPPAEGTPKAASPGP